MGILFGAVHALTFGHSKAVLATYLTASTASVPLGLAVSLVLAFVHVGISVLIALLSLPLVSVALGSVGRAPLLEDISRGPLGATGLWMCVDGAVQLLQGALDASHKGGACHAFAADGVRVSLAGCAERSIHPASFRSRCSRPSTSTSAN